MMQTLSLSPEQCEFKFADSGESWTFEGYASVFNSTDLVGDTVLPGAYKSCIETKGPSGIFMRHEHLRYTAPGKWTHIAEDSKGLHVVGELTPGHTLASDIRASFKHGTIGGLSIGWRPMNSQIERKANGRILKVIDVFEISTTSDPAETQAEVTSFKSILEDEFQSLRDGEHILRDAGVLSRSEAALFVSRFKSVLQRELEEKAKEEVNELKAQIIKQKSAEHFAEIIKRL